MAETNPYQTSVDRTLSIVPSKLPVRAQGALVAADVLAATYSQPRTIYWGPRWQQLIPALVFAVAAIAAWRQYPAENPYFVSLVIVSAGLTLLLLYWGLGRFMVWANAVELCKRESREGPATLTIAETGLIVEANHSKALFEWAAFESARHTPDHVFLTLSSRHDGQVIVIPRRFFDCDEDWSAACLAAERFVMDAAPKTESRKQ